MSWETQSWAAKQRPGSASAKLVLLGLASCADANHCAFPSVKWLCDFGDLNRKTVIAAMQRLAEGMFPMIEDTGERKGRTGQVKVYRLAAAKAIDATLDPASETVPKAEQFQKRNSSGITREQSQKRDTEPFREPLPPLIAKAIKTPAANFHDELNGKRTGSVATRPSRNRGTRLPDDWTPPPVTDLQPLALKLVRQWPSGAYEAVCETFRLHWLNETRAIGCKLDWTAALAKWLIGDHSKIMRDAKAGISFAELAPVRSAAGKSAQPNRPVKAKEHEDHRSAAMHDQMRRRLGGSVYETWIARAAMIFDPAGIAVIVASEFQRDWIAKRFTDQVGDAAREVMGTAIKRVRIEVEEVNNTREKN